MAEEKIHNTIVYVDDEEENLDSFRYIFKRDFNVFTFTNGFDALKLLEKQEIKILIVDQVMPKISGIEVLEKAQKIQPETIKIILSAFTDTNVIIHAINQTNIYRYLTKPWIREELKQILTDAFMIYDLKKENKQLIASLKEKNTALEISNQSITESEKNFKNIVDAVSDALVISDFDGNLLDANKTFYDHTGLTPKQVKKLSTRDFIVLDKPQIFELRRNQIKNKIIPQPMECIVQLPPNDKLPVEIRSNIIQYNNQPAIVTVLKDISQQKETERKVLNAIIETEERERKRIAEDIHDGIGPLLSTLSLYYNSLTSNKYTEEEKNKMLENINNILNEAIITSKNISNELMPNVLNDFGLEAAIRLYVHQVQELNTVNINLNINNSKTRYSKNIETIIYRSILELINNSLKYSRADKIFISFDENEEVIHIVFSDNGIGFDLEETLKLEGTNLGLRNIIYRIKSINGSLNFSQPKTGGIQYNISIPIIKSSKI